MDAQPKPTTAESLRLLADWYEQNPDMPAPYDFKVLQFPEENEAMAGRVARALGTFKKDVDDTFFRLKKQFGALEMEFIFYRSNVCTPRVVGTKTEIVKKPAQDVPMIEVEETREIIEWDCPPLLAAETEAAA